MKFITCVLLMLVFCLAVSATHAADDKTLQNETERINYSVGYQIGGDFLKQGVGVNPDLLVQGVRDAVEQRKPRVAPLEMVATLQDLKKRIVDDERRLRDRQTKDFLSENLKKEGVVRLPNGVQYRVLDPGSGAKPTLEDSVEIHFITRTADGTEIANTYNSGKPMTYRMQDIMPGLQAVLPLMPSGARWEVVIPTGHGGRRKLDTLDTRGILVYEVKLLAVNPG